jgi:putative transcriptional regulator
MPQMLDTSFEHSLIYICDHDERGALGLIINRTLSLSLGEIFQQMDITSHQLEQSHLSVYDGGPVDPTHGLVLYQSNDLSTSWEGTQRFTHDICINSSREILQSISIGAGPSSFLMALGHTGWAPGQLDQEIQDNAWLTCAADPVIMFACPAEKRLERAAQSLGIELHNLSSDLGHA